MTSSQGLTDEQVETLLNALLDFHRLLTGLSNNLQSKLTQVEQRIAAERASTGSVLKPAPALTLLTTVAANEPETVAALPLLPTEPEIPVYELSTANTEVFSVVDFDDDES